ncbi:uncharacterized protein RJT21DRAFT_121915 [Scheffersomyces amazonensis]|uniref:uncharacterized protein n=1 Tax=Scheffersomyces amazonensis TaxID=1078765 RepID=UPI00315D88D4
MNNLPRSKISKRYLKDKRFVKLAIRRKSITKKLGGNHGGGNENVALSPNDLYFNIPPIGATAFGISAKKQSQTHSSNASPISTHSKLHIKSLEAGLRVKLTMADNVISLYHSLIPFTSKKDIQLIFNPDTPISFIGGDSSSIGLSSASKLSKKALVSKSVQLIDNNLVNLSEYSNKILQQFNLYSTTKTGNANNSKEKDSTSINVPNTGASSSSSVSTNSNNSIPTFNNLNTAVSSLFNVKEYSLIRVSRSTTDDSDGSIILKLETCRPGDLKLIDDAEYLDEMLYSLGKPGEPPTNLFIKKIIARPRYKSDMKIYLIPNTSSSDFTLYTDERMFERDLYNGVIDVEFEEQNGDIRLVKTGTRDVFVTFPFEGIVREYKRLIDLSKHEADEDSIEEEPEFEDDKQPTLNPSPTNLSALATPIPSHITPPPPVPPYNMLQHQNYRGLPPVNMGANPLALPPLAQHLMNSSGPQPNSFPSPQGPPNFSGPTPHGFNQSLPPVQVFPQGGYGHPLNAQQGFPQLPPPPPQQQHYVPGPPAQPPAQPQPQPQPPYPYVYYQSQPNTPPQAPNHHPN